MTSTGAGGYVPDNRKTVRAQYHETRASFHAVRKRFHGARKRFYTLREQSTNNPALAPVKNTWEALAFRWKGLTTQYETLAARWESEARVGGSRPADAPRYVNLYNQEEILREQVVQLDNMEKQLYTAAPPPAWVRGPTFDQVANLVGPAPTTHHVQSWDEVLNMETESSHVTFEIGSSDAPGAPTDPSGFKTAVGNPNVVAAGSGKAVANSLSGDPERIKYFLQMVNKGKK